MVLWLANLKAKNPELRVFVVWGELEPFIFLHPLILSFPLSKLNTGKGYKRKNRKVKKREYLKKVYPIVYPKKGK